MPDSDNDSEVSSQEETQPYSQIIDDSDVEGDKRPAPEYSQNETQPCSQIKDDSDSQNETQPFSQIRDDSDDKPPAPEEEPNDNPATETEQIYLTAEWLSEAVASNCWIFYICIKLIMAEGCECASEFDEDTGVSLRIPEGSHIRAQLRHDGKLVESEEAYSDIRFMSCDTELNLSMQSSQPDISLQTMFFVNGVQKAMLQLSAGSGGDGDGGPYFTALDKDDDNKDQNGHGNKSLEKDKDDDGEGHQPKRRRVEDCASNSNSSRMGSGGLQQRSNDANENDSQNDVVKETDTGTGVISNPKTCASKSVAVIEGKIDRRLGTKLNQRTNPGDNEVTPVSKQNRIEKEDAPSLETANDGASKRVEISGDTSNIPVDGLLQPASASPVHASGTSGDTVPLLITPPVKPVAAGQPSLAEGSHVQHQVVEPRQDTIYISVFLESLEDLSEQNELYGLGPKGNSNSSFSSTTSEGSRDREVCIQIFLHSKEDRNSLLEEQKRQGNSLLKSLSCKANSGDQFEMKLSKVPHSVLEFSEEDGVQALEWNDIRTYMTFFACYNPLSDQKLSRRRLAFKLQVAKEDSDHPCVSVVLYPQIPQNPASALRKPCAGIVYPPQTPHIFISYRRSHLDLADRIRCYLTYHFGYEAFLDTHPESGLSVGNFQMQLEEKLRQAKLFIPVLTPAPSGDDERRRHLSYMDCIKDSARRGGEIDWCHRELQIALDDYRNEKKMIIPVFRNVNIGDEYRDLPADISDLGALQSLPIVDAYLVEGIARISKGIQMYLRTKSPCI